MLCLSYGDRRGQAVGSGANDDGVVGVRFSRFCKVWPDLGSWMWIGCMLHKARKAISISSLRRGFNPTPRWFYPPDPSPDFGGFENKF